MKEFIKQRLGEWGWLGLVTLPAAVLYFSNITRWSIWHDESFTAMIISYDWGEILRRTALDVHPPLYYLILKLWTGVFGDSLLALRGFSAVAMLGVIIVAYWLAKSLFGKGTARLATVFLALAPFLLRYAQEARMYAIVALFLLLASYALVTAVKKQSAGLLYLYGFLVALAVYCHYYALFIVPAFWVYVLLLTKKKGQLKSAISLKNRHWWFANILILLLLAPWLPTAYRQFTAIQGSFWIGPVSHTTFLSTIANFIYYQEYWMLDAWQKLWLWCFSTGIFLAVPTAIYFNKLQRRGLALVAAYAFLPPLIIFLLSLPPFQPVYNNRYFSLSSPAFYILLAALVYSRPINRWRITQVIVVAAVVLTFLFGISNVRQIGNFNFDKREAYAMEDLAYEVNTNFTAGDIIISNELFHYFDIAFYNQTQSTVLLKADGRPSGGGNTSLVYDRDDILLFDYSQIKPTFKRVWLITEASNKQPDIPDSWQLISRTDKASAAVSLYDITSQPNSAQDDSLQVCAQVITKARNILTGETREFGSACLPEGWRAISP